jgi:hypothetical protein
MIMKLKFLAAAAAIATLMAGPATAREVYHHRYHHYHHVGPVGAAAGAAAGIAGAAIGTAGAVAAAPFGGGPYAYDRGYYDRGYDPYYGPGPYYRRGW